MPPVTRTLNLPTLTLALAAVLSQASSASACGCFSPPIPQPAEVNFAVNQQAEQIIFEVEDGYVTAHVLIKYAGEPEKFGWIVPVPGVPELSLSYNEVFGLVDQQTAPRVSSFDQSYCPQQRYQCNYHSQPYCGGGVDANTSSGDGSANFAPSAAGGSGNVAGAPPVVQVLARQTIGAYDTVVLAATPDAPDAGSALVMWLNEEGFITNESMAPYLMPYLAEGMVFVAARLVPDAGVDQIRPLKMRYQGTQPMIPLQLTAVAAEPHLPVSAIIYSDVSYQPAGFPLIEIDADEISNDSSGRNNYPMVLSRAVDDAGGAAFVVEYSGPPPVYQDPTGCCSQPGNDWCFVGNDTQCQCPGADFDAADCEDEEELVGAIETVSELAERYSVVTRLTTRISPEEMTFDPYFEPRSGAGEVAYPQGNLVLQGNRRVLTGCQADILDAEEYQDITALEDCASVYCGEGSCVATDGGVGCACNDGFVARSFSDLDGRPSITCVPEQGTVDFAAGGIDIPDVCAGRAALSDGECIPVGGFVTTACDAGFASVLNGSDLPDCREIVASSDSPGAQHMTHAIADLDVCAPPPPSCGSTGWLEEYDVAIPGVQCGPKPHESWFVEPPAPTCGTFADGVAAATTQPRPEQSEPMDTTQPRPSFAADSSGCSLAPGPHGAAGALWAALIALAWGYRRRRTS